MGNLKEIEHGFLGKDDLGEKICIELEIEEFRMTGEWTPSTIQDLDIHQQKFGIYMNKEGLASPIYGKPKGKRGRRSLKELRESEGLARDQKKIDELLNTGKGKCLPKAS